MAYLRSIDDSDWEEVRLINGYAIFMGYLMMGVRGLGVLVITWTTVVLLGGFVSVLGKKDFWCLTGITLVQTAGVFNFLSRDKLSDTVHLSWGLLGAVLAIVSRLSTRKDETSDDDDDDDDLSVPQLVVAPVLSALQLLVFAVILCPLVVLFMFGLYISAAVSLWRLIEHDFSYADGGSNLKPALEVLYGLAVAQGLLFSYRTMHYFGAKIGLVEFVAQRCSMDKNLVSDYLKDTVVGCENDSSFATGRNLVTCGVNLMAAEPNSNSDSFIAGVRILGTPTTDDDKYRKVLLEHLLTRSAAFGHIILRLLQTLDPRSHYREEDMECAVRVVASVAVNIHLQRFTEVIPFISSLLINTLELEDVWLELELDNEWLQWEDKWSEKLDGNGQLELGRHSLLVVEKVFHILGSLATHGDNCIIISNAQGVLFKTLRCLISVQYHSRCRFHDSWCSMAKESLELISRLSTGASGGTEVAPDEISGNLQEIQDTIRSILECTKCDVSLKREAVKVVLDLSMDTSSFLMASPSRSEIFTWMLLHISALLDGAFDRTCDFSPRLKKRSRMRQRLARGKLKGKESAIIGHLTRIITGAAGNNKFRLQAVQLLLDLCRNESRCRVTTIYALFEVMPELLKVMLDCESSTSEETHAAETRPNDDQLSARSSDIERGSGEQDASSQRHNGEKQHVGIELQEAFISLCRDMFRTLNHKLRAQLNVIAANTCLAQEIPVKDFKSLVSYAQDRMYKSLQAQ